MTKPISLRNIKHAFYINLDSRPDRREQVEAELISIGISALRFPAVCLQNGAIGCTLSHLKLLRMAREKNFEHVLIVEDDIQFLKPSLFQKQANAFLSSNIPFDVLLFAGNNVGTYTRIGDFSARIQQCQTTTGYLIMHHYYDQLIQNIEEGLGRLMHNPLRVSEFAIDKYWFSLQKNNQWFLITPLTVTQREGYSDIEHKQTNYSTLMLQLEKPTIRPMAAHAQPPRRFDMHSLF